MTDKDLTWPLNRHFEAKDYIAACNRNETVDLRFPAQNFEAAVAEITRVRQFLSSALLAGTALSEECLKPTEERDKERIRVAVETMKTISDTMQGPKEIRQYRLAVWNPYAHLDVEFTDGMHGPLGTLYDIAQPDGGQVLLSRVGFSTNDPKWLPWTPPGDYEATMERCHPRTPARIQE